MQDAHGGNYVDGGYVAPDGAFYECAVHILMLGVGVIVIADDVAAVDEVDVEVAGVCVSVCCSCLAMHVLMLLPMTLLLMMLFLAEWTHSCVHVGTF